MTSSVDSQDKSPSYPEPGHDGATGYTTEINVIHHDDRALPHERLATRSFLSLLFVQFLTVLNDHTFRWLVVPIAKLYLWDWQRSQSLSFCLLLLLDTLPIGFPKLG